MSDITEGVEELLDEPVEAEGDAVGSTSDEVEQTSEESSEEKESLLQSMSIYDAMLLVSLICVAVATLLLFFELNTFGDFPGGFPWRTNEL
jgi:hypothetical protein